MANRRPGRWRPVGTPTNFSTPVRDGAVLPVLHLNGYKIANPTILARIPPEELEMLFKGLDGRRMWWKAMIRSGCTPKMAEVLEGCVLDIRAIQDKARKAPPGQTVERPKVADDYSAHAQGWTGPKQVNGHKVERVLAGAPDSDSGSENQPGEPGKVGSLAAKLSAGGVV